MVEGHGEREAGYELLETAVKVEFEILASKSTPSHAGENIVVTTAEIQLAGEDEPGTDVEWGAFGFMFALAVQSFHDARPRGVSDIDFVENDEFTVADLFRCLRYERGELRFTSDYVRGRCMKTDVTIRPDGKVEIETRNRGESLFRWLDRFKGKKPLTVVGGEGETDPSG
ncbi:MAG: hypothetical protein HY905_03870 [Deltaproteobacteria bacterium]|nr:hypothetical protein [Deltaproteobacteria bacterium]